MRLIVYVCVCENSGDFNSSTLWRHETNVANPVIPAICCKNKTESEISDCVQNPDDNNSYRNKVILSLKLFLTCQQELECMRPWKGLPVLQRFKKTLFVSVCLIWSLE